MDGGHAALIKDLAAAVGARLVAAGLRVTVAESCTGGLLAAALTAIPGSSAWFEAGFVTYTPRAKHILLGVPWAHLDEALIVSAPTAIAMAHGAHERGGAEVAVGVTGYAGPTGGTPACPVGTVAIGWVTARGEQSQVCHFSGDREAVRAQAVAAALAGLKDRLDQDFPR